MLNTIGTVSIHYFDVCRFFTDFLVINDQKRFWLRKRYFLYDLQIKGIYFQIFIQLDMPLFNFIKNCLKMSSYSFMRWPQGNCEPSSNHVHIFDREKFLIQWFIFDLMTQKSLLVWLKLKMKNYHPNYWLKTKNSSLLSFEHLKTIMSNLIKYTFET